MIPSTTRRVPNSTSESINHPIRQETLRNIARLQNADKAAIGQLLAELEAEWDIERLRETNAATVDRRWFLLPAAVAGFLLQHAVQVGVLRYLCFVEWASARPMKLTTNGML